MNLEQIILSDYFFNLEFLFHFQIWGKHTVIYILYKCLGQKTFCILIEVIMEIHKNYEGTNMFLKNYLQYLSKNQI